MVKAVCLECDLAFDQQPLISCPRCGSEEVMPEEYAS